jgi:hypothetical protein
VDVPRLTEPPGIDWKIDQKQIYLQLKVNAAGRRPRHR